MNRIILSLKRPFIRLYRFRHRQGYGVHSPFAFHLITQVIYQHTPYYKYKDLEAEQERLIREKGEHWLYESRKVKHLLFRLVNYVQPDTLIDAGTLSASSLYLKAGKEAADYISASSLSELFLETGHSADFLYLHDYRRTDFVEEVFRLCAARTTEKSLFVVEGIRYTRPMRALWERMKQNERVGITFDLYDLGLLFFDKSRTKQDYTVNF